MKENESIVVSDETSIYEIDEECYQHLTEEEKRLYFGEKSEFHQNLKKGKK